MNFYNAFLLQATQLTGEKYYLYFLSEKGFEKGFFFPENKAEIRLLYPLNLLMIHLNKTSKISAYQIETKVANPLALQSLKNNFFLARLADFLLFFLQYSQSNEQLFFEMLLQIRSKLIYGSPLITLIFYFWNHFLQIQGFTPIVGTKKIPFNHCFCPIEQAFFSIEFANKERWDYDFCVFYFEIHQNFTRAESLFSESQMIDFYQKMEGKLQNYLHYWTGIKIEKSLKILDF